MRRAHIYLLAILLLHAGVAAVDEAYWWLYAPDGEGIAEAAWMISPVIYWVPLVVLLFVWCIVDARNRHVKRPLGAAILVALVFPVGVPYYYWRTYARRAAVVHIGLFVIFAVACFATLRFARMIAGFYFLNA